MAKGPVFRLTPENALRSELQAGKVRPAYFFYGEEDFLTRTYTDMVIKTAGALEGDGLNLLVSVTGVNAQLHVELDGLVELGLGGLADEVHALSGFILSALIDQLGALLIFLASKQCYSSS